MTSAAQSVFYAIPVGPPFAFDPPDLGAVDVHLDHEQLKVLQDYAETAKKVGRNAGTDDNQRHLLLASQALKDSLVALNGVASLRETADTIVAQIGEPEERVQALEVAFEQVKSPSLIARSLLFSVIKKDLLTWAGGDGHQPINPLINYGPLTAPRPNIELVFSGGGLRSAAFSSGVLMYLSDARRLGGVRQISSVSGGSITNGFVADTLASKQTLDESDFAVYVNRLARSGLPLERLGKTLRVTLYQAVSYLVVSLLLFLLFCLGIVDSLFIVGFGAVASAGLGVLNLWIIWQFFTVGADATATRWFAKVVSIRETAGPVTGGLRSLSAHRLRSSLLAPVANVRRRLSDISSPITHVFSATDIRHGEHIHFSQGWITSSTLGTTVPGSIFLDEAVRASAAFPGAIPPLKISRDRLHFPPHLTTDIKTLQVVDGGVRDNLGHIFQTLLLGGDDPSRAILTHYDTTVRWIVADASAPRGVIDLGESVVARSPVLRKVDVLVTFPRVLGIMNQSNSEARSLALKRFLEDHDNGFVASIRESPIDLCRRFLADVSLTSHLLRGDTDLLTSLTDSRKVNAARALLLLAESEPAVEALWSGTCNWNQETPTSLDELGDERLVSLLRHGYVLAMCYSHIVSSWPLMPFPSWSDIRFIELLEPGRQAGARRSGKATSSGNLPQHLSPDIFVANATGDGVAERS